MTIIIPRSLYQSTYENPMLNYYNTIYLGVIYAGTPLQGFRVVHDTGSGPFMLRSSICKDCDGSSFQIDESSSFAYMDPPAWDEVTYSGAKTLYGRMSTEKVCPSLEICTASDF